MGIRTLVVEDNPANLELMTYLLRAFKHTVLQATDGESGLEIARRERPDLIVCDVHLPGIDGFEVARQLKGDAILNEIPLIAVTALAMVGDRDKVLAAGFDGYVSKPINPESFVGDVESFLQRQVRSLEERSPAINPTTPGNGRTNSPARATILVMDDDSQNLELAHDILEPSGYKVITAHGVTQALQLARQARPDLILSDVHVPGESGFDLIRAVKADPELRATTFAFLTSTAKRDIDMANGLALGAADFIVRPIEPKELLTRIEACLRKKSGE